jgi:hypothetical protein
MRRKTPVSHRHAIMVAKVFHLATSVTASVKRSTQDNIANKSKQTTILVSKPFFILDLNDF